MKLHAMIETGSYRTSHEQKGRDYHRAFATGYWRGVIWQLEQRRLDSILRRRFPRGVADYLDFACGTGRVLAYLEGRARRPVGVDVARSMLQVAQGAVRRADIIRADITRDEVFSHRRFDLITAFRFFPNAEASLRQEAIRALKNHLKPNGILVCNNHLKRGSSVRVAMRLVGRRAPYGMAAEEMYELVQHAGLKILEQHPIGVLPLSDKWAVRPQWLFRGLEAFTSSLPGVGGLAQNVIYVICNHESGPASQ